MWNSPSATDPKPAVLVWGGLGFLGQYIVERLLRSGANVSVLCRSKNAYSLPLWADRVQWFETAKSGAGENGASSPELVRAVAGATVIFNFAGLSGAAASNRDPMRSLDENCRVQLAFLAACKLAGHRPHVVFPSSWLVYSPAGQQCVSETHPTAPLSLYGAHKLCIEHYLRIFARQGDISFTACRISNPYGYDPSHAKSGYKILNAFIEAALAKRPIRLFGDGTQLRDFLYIDDVIEALFLAGFTEQARNEVLNIGSGRSHSLVQAVQTVTEIAGPTAVEFVPWPDEYLATEPGDYLADITRANTLLGFYPRYDLRTGLQESVRISQQNSAAMAQWSGA